MLCDIIQFPLHFFAPHAKPYGARGLRNHYNMLLYPKLGHVKCTIHQVSCMYYAFTYMLDKHW